MNDPINTLKESAGDVRLSRAAYERMRATLLAHMSVTPAAVPSSYLGRLSPYVSFLRRPVFALAVVLLIGVGGATTYAAHGSLPGDPLYPLKVKVLEPVQGLLAVTPEAKAEFKAGIAAERLSEVAQLAARQKLTPEQGALSEEDFNASLEAAQAAVSALAKHNPEAAAHVEASLSESLDEHQRAIEAVGLSATSSSAEEAHRFSAHVKAELDSEATTTEDNGNGNGKGEGNGEMKLNGGAELPLPGTHGVRGADESESLLDN